MWMRLLLSKNENVLTAERVQNPSKLNNINKKGSTIDQKKYNLNSLNTKCKGTMKFNGYSEKTILQVTVRIAAFELQGEKIQHNKDNKEGRWN